MNDFDVTRKILKTINEAKSNSVNYSGKTLISKLKLLKEEYEDANSGEDGEEDEGIPVTDDPKFGNQTLTNQKESAKEIGADFKNFDTPLIFYPEDGDLVFSGEIPDMNDLKFQFRYKDSSGQGCYMWVEGLQLTDENVKKINRIQGFYKNWKDEITKTPLF